MKEVRVFDGTYTRVTSGVAEIALDNVNEGKDMVAHPENYAQYADGSTAFCARTDGEMGLNVWLKENGAWKQVAGETL